MLDFQRTPEYKYAKIIMYILYVFFDREWRLDKEKPFGTQKDMLGKAFAKIFLGLEIIDVYKVVDGRQTISKTSFGHFDCRFVRNGESFIFKITSDEIRRIIDLLRYYKASDIKILEQEMYKTFCENDIDFSFTLDEDEIHSMAVLWNKLAKVTIINESTAEIKVPLFEEFTSYVGRERISSGN